MLREVLRICVVHISRTLKMAGAGLGYSYWERSHRGRLLEEDSMGKNKAL